MYVGLIPVIVSMLMDEGNNAGGEDDESDLTISTW